MARTHSWWVHVLIFGGIIALGAWPWRAVRVGASEALSALANPVLSQLTFDRGVSVRLQPLPVDAVRRPDDNVEADTEVVLSVPETPAEARFGISLRRDAYLPLLIFAALALALPLRPRDKALCLGVGIPTVVAAAVASIVTLVTYFLGVQKGSTVSELQREITTFLFERWLTPPNNRVIAPVLLALALAAYVSRDSLRARAASRGALDTQSLQTAGERHE
jgi:hypothetical protein